MKTKDEIIHLLGLHDEEKLVVAKALEKGAEADQRNILICTRFLSPSERNLVQKAASYAQYPFTFWGGSEQAERKIGLFFPSYQNENEARLVAPLVVLRCTTATTGLAHRDYLGALMALQIKRELVGDIYVRENGADIVICAESADFLQDHLTDVAKAKVTTEILPVGRMIITESEPQLITDTVASLRLDTVVSLGFRMSRSLAGEFIHAGRVILNGQACTKPDKEVAEKDVFSIRGKGRVILDQVGGVSKKGRQYVELKKY